MKMKRLLFSLRTVSFALSLLLCASVATAAPTFKDRLAARKLASKGKQLARQGKHKKAAKKFKEADDLVPAPSYKLELAEMLLELGDMVQAMEVLEECMDQKPIRQWQEKLAQKKCIQLASKVDDKMPRIAVVVIEPSSEEVIIMIEGEDYDPSEGEVGFNPGKYEVTAEADGYKSFEKKVKVEEGDRKTVEVTLKAKKKDDDDEDEDEDEGDDSWRISPIPAYVAWGLGAVGVGVGIGFGIAAIQTTNEVRTVYECDGNTCPPDAEDDLNVAKLNGNLSTAGWIVGGVGVIGGTVLFLVSTELGDDEEMEEGADEGKLELEARPVLGPGYIGVTGTF
jgi:hypothetical protein